jgi:hypothetical protein
VKKHSRRKQHSNNNKSKGSTNPLKTAEYVKRPARTQQYINELERNIRRLTETISRRKKLGGGTTFLLEELKALTEALQREYDRGKKKEKG